MKHNYEELGLKAGLEIHQQLNTNKLFCNCPSLLRKDQPLYEIERKLNPVVGETGELDIAAEYEKSKDKKFKYQVYDTNCLVELDEEPPHEINQEALKIALQISLLLKCKIYPVTQVMRKTVVNGSNTSGFQRTMMLAHGGYIETSAGRISIDAVMLEEDSARKVSEEGNVKTYKLDRLGIPLVEIATGPHMHTPEQIKEAALKIGEILRACNVMRGIGTIRQDVNISIKGSERVEIKGFQDPKMMIETIDKEIERQKECVKNKSCKKEVRNALPDGKTKFLRPMPGAARMYPETDIPLLKISKELINEVKKNLPKLSSENRGYLKEFGLNEELVKDLLKENKVDEFKSLLITSNNPILIAKMLTIYMKASKRINKNAEERLSIDVLEEILKKVEINEVSLNDVSEIMDKISSGKSLEESCKKTNIDLKSEVKNLLKEKPGLSQGAYMGLIMGKHKGVVTGREVADILKELM